MTTTAPAAPARAPLSDPPARATAGDAVRVIAWLCLTAFLVVPFAGASLALLRPGPSRPPADSATLVLPDRLSYPAWRTPSAAQDPGGAASVVMTGSQLPFTRIQDTNAAALIGRGGYRMTPRSPLDEIHPGEQLLLSPDGRAVFYNEGLIAPFGTAHLQDLTTGRVLDVTLPAHRDALAWLPGGRGLVLSPGLDVGSADLGVWDLAMGTYRPIADAPINTGAGVGTALLPDGFAVAVSPDATRLAWQLGPRLRISRIDDGRQLLNLTLPTGTTLGGKGAWTPDGRSLAVTELARGHNRWQVSLLDAATGQRVAAPGFTPVRDALALRTLGWRADGELLAVAFRPERGARPPLGERTYFEYVRRADLVGLRPGRSPRTVLRAPSQVLAIDVADHAIATNGTFANPTPPRVILPTVGYVVIALTTGALLLAHGSFLSRVVRHGIRPRP